MERLLDDESKRLEKRLRHQMQAQKCQEKARQTHEEKQRSLASKGAYVEKRREAALREKEERARRAREFNDEHARLIAEKKSEQEAALEMRQASYAAAAMQ